VVSVFVTAGSDLGTGIEFIFYAVFYPEFRLNNNSTCQRQGRRFD